MRSDALTTRLRAGNPVSKAEGVDEALLARLLAESREPAGRLRLRRAAVLFAAAAVLLGGTAAGVQRFVVDYFGSDDAEPTPASIIAELRRLDLAAGGDFGTVDAESFVRLAAFDGEHGRVTIYIAPTTAGDGYCIASADGSVVDGGSCSKNAEPEMQIPYGSYWNSDAGDVHIVYSRLPADIASIEVRFEDGAVRPASIRPPWWIYVVGGTETEAGHRPTALVARSADGVLLATERLDPYTFWSRAQAEAALPESDGSPGQDAVRSALAGVLPSAGRIAEQLQLDRTRLVKTIATSRGDLDVYSAPWGEGGVCFGYATSGFTFDRTISGCPSGQARPDQPERFDADQVEVDAADPDLVIVDGTPPAGSGRVSVRFEDGTSAEMDISIPSFFISWFDADRLVPGHRPQGLVAWDPQGRVIDRFELDPALLAP
jgi:hypothetical protein